MKNFKYLDKEIEFYKSTGIVLDDKKFSETHVSSSGGGGYVNQYGGHVSAPQVTSSSTTHQEIWYKKENGDEKSIQLEGDIPLRIGHKISEISAGNKDSDTCWRFALINHSTKKYWLLNNATDLNKLLDIDKPIVGGWALLMCFSFPLIISLPELARELGETQVAFTIIGGLIAFYIYCRRVHSIRFDNINIDQSTIWWGANLLFLSYMSISILLGQHSFAIRDHMFLMLLLFGGPISYNIYYGAKKIFRINNMLKALNLHLENAVKEAMK